MPVRTSLTHPLEIDPMPCGAGLLGLTLCPGKQGPSNFGGPWERDLGLDMRAIVDWGATTLVSLMEAHEFPMLNVPGLGDAAEEAGVEWHHLPIPDVKVPGERFERLWTYSGHVLRGKLRAGEKIVLHCRGGLGRTGMVAARLAIEFGVAPEEALRRVREARTGTVETRAQEAYVLRQRASKSDERYADRVLGCLLGGAVGDALGYEVEFLRLAGIRERFGPEGIKAPALNAAGQAVVSDDTQMTIFTAEGLIDSIERNGSLTQAEALDSVRAATLDWYAMQTGKPANGGLSEYSILGEGRAPGMTCKDACAHGATGTPENPINDSKGCGGVMRVAPVGLCLELSDEGAFELAARCAAQTHGHPSGYLSAGALAAIVRNLIDGLEPDRCAARAVELARRRNGADETIAAFERAHDLASAGSAHGPRIPAQLGKGWVGEEALAIAWYSVLAANDFADAMRMAANHDGDSDSTASIAGQVYGAWKGLHELPHGWIRRLDALEPLADIAGRMLAARGEG